jgi:RNA methyltransferase, TrmH family
MRRLSPYRADLPFTYAFGRFAALEALTHVPNSVRRLVVHRDLPHHALARLEAASAAVGVALERDDATVERLRRKATVTCLAVVDKTGQRLAPDRDHVALVRPSHFGNVGSAMRSLVAFGFADVAFVAPDVAEPVPALDPWSPNVIRASVGLRFALRCQTFADPATYAASFPSHATFVFDADGAVALDDARFVSPFTLWFGPEWPGTRGERAFLPGAGDVVRVRIPQDRRVESLNLAVAISIAAYRARRSSATT